MTTLDCDDISFYDGYVNCKEEADNNADYGIRPDENNIVKMWMSVMTIMSLMKKTS